MSPTIPASTADDVGGLQFPTGLGPFPYLGTAQPAGWYLVKAGQGFELEAIADFPALAQLVGSRWGGDGITTFAMPQAGLFTRGPDGVHALWSLFGEDTNMLTLAELAPHNHPLTGAPGLHDPGHGHGVNDPGHGHGVNDPGHQHDDVGPSNDGADWGGTSNLTWRALLGKVTAAFTSISIQGSGTGISIQGNGTGITTDAGTLAVGDAGAGAPHNNVPLTLVTNLIVKA